MQEALKHGTQIACIPYVRQTRIGISTAFSQLDLWLFLLTIGERMLLHPLAEGFAMLFL
jgi:hypothetical protein